MTEQFADTSSNIVVLSLASADLLVCGVSAPLFIYNYFHPIFTIFINVRKFNAVAIAGSLFTLSLDRYISLVRVLNYSKIMTFKQTITLVVGIWAIAIFVVIITVFGLVRKIKPFVHITHYFLGFYLLVTTLMYVCMYDLGRKQVFDT